MRVNLIGTWRPDLSELLGVMSAIEPVLALRIYCERMKIEQTFRDLKSLLQLDKLMNQQHAMMEQVIALVLLAFSLGTLIGEQFKDEWCAEQSSTQRTPARRGPRARAQAAQRKRQRYSGLFILLKLKLSWSAARVKRIVRKAYHQFMTLLFPPVRTFI